MKGATMSRAVRFALLVKIGGVAALASLAIGADAAEKLTPRSYRLADSAYKAIAAGDFSAAERYAAGALRAQPSSMQLGLLMLEVFMREGKIAEADAQAELLLKRYPDNASVLAQHGFSQQRQSLYETAEHDFELALRHGQWNATQERSLRLAWADSALAAHDPDGAQRAMAPLESEPDTAVQLRVAQLRLRNGDRAGALSAAQLAESNATTEADKQSAATLMAFTQAPAPKDDTAMKTLQTAYDLLRQHEDQEALEAFRRGFAAGAGNAGNHADAGYAAKRLGQNDEAVAFFKESLDADDREHTFDEQRRFGYRREVQQLERTWGFVLSVPYQVSAFTPQGTAKILQPGIEAYWQPPKIGYQNGRILQFYVRGFVNAYDASGNVTGLPTVQGSVGARYKPIEDQNLVVAAERLVRIGRLSTNDWLARLGYSSEAGLDLRVTEPSWRSWQVYAEADYFLHQGRYLLYSELRYGHTWAIPAISDRLTVYPHAAFVFNLDSREVNRTAMGVGPGIQLRHWFRESRYSAPASYVDVTVQYRLPLTKAARGRGLVVQATLWY